MALGELIRLEDLPTEVRSGREESSAAAAPAVTTLAEAERRAIAAALAAAAGNKSRAAALLGISRDTLYRKLERDAPPGGGASGS